ncbi:MAG: Dabb family protein [Sedimentisphaerales bacterium]|nr:Dabb family protein [Sedimentisphaerales bacterium]
MMRNFLYLSIGMVLLAGCVSVHETRHVTEKKTVEGPDRVLRHVVLFKFKDGTTDQQIKQIEEAFCALPNKVDAIYDLEWGTNVSVEGRSEGFTHCFLVTFLSEADRAEYLPHPDHKAFGKIVGPHLDKVLVVDYWTR